MNANQSIDLEEQVRSELQECWVYGVNGLTDNMIDIYMTGDSLLIFFLAR